MPRSVSQLDKEASELSQQDRALLVERLLTTLDQGTDADAEELWLDEAERRYQAYRAGGIGAKPAAQVFEDVRKKMR
jgi:putative addiction module component (TIGR02574 family)